jgi:hypothetical protein
LPEEAHQFRVHLVRRGPVDAVWPTPPPPPAESSIRSRFSSYPTGCAHIVILPAATDIQEREVSDLRRSNS